MDPSARSASALILSALLGLGLVAGCDRAPVPAAPSASTPSVDQILDAHAKAVGGEAAWKRHASRTTRSTMKLEGGFDQHGNPRNAQAELVVLRRAPNLLLSTSTVEGVGSIKVGFDGTRGWTEGPGRRRRWLSGPELAELGKDATYGIEFDYRRAYPKAELVGPFRIHEMECWQVRLTAPDGAVADAYFDKATGRCAALGRRLGPEGQSMLVVRYFTDYAEFDGVWLPRRITQSLGENTQEEQLVSVDWTELPDALFAPPAALEGQAPSAPR